MKDKIKKVPAIEISKIGGLKCDNINCDWEDMTVLHSEYKSYIDYKCPKCGENILTKGDYNSFKLTMAIVNIFNFILPKRVPNKEKDSTMTCKFDGIGKVTTNIKINEDI